MEFLRLYFALEHIEPCMYLVYKYIWVIFYCIENLRIFYESFHCIEFL